mgnify:CR=1 FL=1
MAKIKILQKPCQKDAAKRPAVERVLANRKTPEILKEFAKGRYFYIRTYGCQGNVRDEEVMAGFLTEAGFTRTEDASLADVAIINTCAVRENAEDKIYGEIGNFKANKKKNPDFMLVLAGCVMGEDGVGEKLIETYPFISLVIGTHDVAKINDLLAEVIKERKSIINVHSFSSEIVENLPSVRLDNNQAFVNISYGCDKFCTYCIVPFTRGRERSRHLDDIVAECKKLVEEGYKQITLLGQNVNSYGLDLKDGTDFAKLLSAAAETGIPRLRFLTSYPSQFSDEMIDVMAKYENIDHWLHFPVQSGSSSCLRRMARRYTREEYLERANKIKEKMPDIALTTDIIVGFPGETEEEFLERRQKEVKPLFDSLHKWLLEKKALDIRESSKTKEAINYCLNRWDNLTRFLNYSYLTTSTNSAEQTVRPFTLLRKNSMFYGSGEGARSSCWILTMIETAKIHNISPEDYLRCVFERAPYCKSDEDWEKLLPWNIKITPYEPRGEWVKD